MRLVPAASTSREPYSRGAEAAGSIDGVPIQQVPTTVRRSLATGAVGPTSENVVVFVDSPNPEVVDDLLSTVSVIPDGYAPLPAPTYRRTLAQDLASVANRGRLVLALPRLAKGTQKLVVTYGGSPTVAPASKVFTVRAR